MPIKLPKNCLFYIFGSFLFSKFPNDLDLIIVYDPAFYKSETVDIDLIPFIKKLEFYFNLKVDFYLFSSDEIGNFHRVVKGQQIFKFSDIIALKEKIMMK